MATWASILATSARQRHFLLFAGSHHRVAGGLRDLVATYDDEVAAWAAFQELRQAHPSREGWAELAAIDTFGHVTQLAWFGLHRATPAGDTATPVRTLPITRGRRPPPTSPPTCGRSRLLKGRPGQQQPLLPHAGEADDHLGRVAPTDHLQDHALAELAVDDVVAHPDAQAFGPGGAHGP